MRLTRTYTADGFIPHFVHRGRAYPVCVVVDNPRKAPAIDVDKLGFAYYALAGGGKATVSTIKAKRAA